MNEYAVTKASSARLPTAHGEFVATVYVDEVGAEHMALSCYDKNTDKAPLVRLHSECLTGDVFASRRCDCGEQLDIALSRIAAEGHGVLLYLRQEGRGIGLTNKLRAYELQDQGMDTVEANEHLGFPADARDYRVAADMLKLEGVKRVRVMTNNPRKVKALEEQGIEIEQRLEIIAAHEPEREGYLSTKADKLGHLFGR
ncbi:MAG: GTP cyclohydrolase II [Pseudomonadota bacterium]